MVRAATIVPTVSDEYGDGIPSRHSHAGNSDEAEGAERSSEETNVPASPVAELQAENYLQAAFNGQISKAHPKPDDPIPSPLDRFLQQSDSNVAQHKPVPPIIGKSLLQRSQSAVIKKKKGVELTKNYAELVRDFRHLRPFARRPDGKYPADTLCVYCVNAKPTSVFFPCQHMCVCSVCIELNHISTDYSSSTDWCACPVCMADIRLILLHSGNEEEKYWKWVFEVKPCLPSQFKQVFKEAGKRLSKNAPPTRGRRSSFVTMFRRVPPPQEEAPKEPPPKPKVPVLGRRHSWQPGEVANVRNVAASNEQEESHNCAIL
ncbi:hypothetical protein PHYPSEUDO_014757 [Phytophthora pseudosyringae]|uniref:RING-type domain-containing protein n=1 Tax=Phytophthora pseudosyringae TaxID=221518 RepID=A0A8T1W4Q8_9STRA|nr:hypothetical protein PHYPSEUDO_014757 [Phytophthora pseudosyringae]